MNYHYFIDTKLLAYFLTQRKSSILDIYNKIAELLINKPKGKVYLAFDDGKSSYRCGIYSQYKGHRTVAKSKKSEEEMIISRKFESDYLSLIEFSKGLNVHVLAVRGVEADDLISIEVEKLKQDPNNFIYLITGDMDYINSVVGTNNVVICNALKSGEIIDNEYVKNTYSSLLNSRDRFNVHKSIFGDKSDNIKFLRNFGEQKATEVFENLYSKYEEPTIEHIVEEVVEVIKRFNNIKVHENHIVDGRHSIKDAIEANLKLADTFRDTSNFTEEQLKMYNECISRVPPRVSDSNHLILKGLELFNEPVVLYRDASRVFNVK